MIDALPVPAGDYLLSESLGGRQTVGAFSLDRTPVTVAAYREFIAADGYAQADLWDDEGWHWRVVNDVHLPRFFDEADPKWQAYLAPDHPVIGVSYYEAVAYCRFVGRRLPSERQWEAAARGADGRDYPWGNDWQAGGIEARGGARLTRRVGAQPAARGPFGHEDLVGNVWQWTGDVYGGVRGHGGEAMAVRGGSWASRPEQCRTSYRNGYARDGRWSHVGFRTAGPA